MTIEKRLERLEAILDARGLDWDHPRVASDHFAGASKMVAEGPPKKWRRLTDEFVQPGDWMNAKVNRQDVYPPGGDWIPADPCYFGKRACTLSFYFARPVADEPAKEAEPAWEPKVGDWVRVTRPENWEKCWSPCWLAEMHQFDGKVGCIERVQGSCRRIRGFVGSDGLQYQFHRDWLSPAEPPAIDKPPEPEYREPVLPDDLGKWAEFSQDGINWMRYKLRGCHKESEASLTIWSEKNIGFRHCRIKNDA